MELGVLLTAFNFNCWNISEQSRVSREITNSLKCQNTFLSSCQGLQLPISISRTSTHSKLHQFAMKPDAEVGLLTFWFRLGYVSQCVCWRSIIIVWFHWFDVFKSRILVCHICRNKNLEPFERGCSCKSYLKICLMWGTPVTRGSVCSVQVKCL